MRRLRQPLRSMLHSVLMGVETLGDAFAAGWRIIARCVWASGTA